MVAANEFDGPDYQQHDHRQHDGIFGDVLSVQIIASTSKSMCQAFHVKCLGEALTYSASRYKPSEARAMAQTCHQCRGLNGKD